MINEKAYARIYNYLETNYDTVFALKRTKNKLTSTELIKI